MVNKNSGTDNARGKRQNLSDERKKAYHYVRNLLDKLGSSKEIKEAGRDFFVGKMKKFIKEYNILVVESQEGKVPFEKNYIRYRELINYITLEGDKLEKLINNKPMARQIKKVFRIIVSDWVHKSEMVIRGLEKPLGYPGDYLLLEMIYNNKLISKDMRGLFAEQYFLDNSYAVAVRERKNLMVKFLANSINNLSSDMQALNLACGSCREIRELIADKKIDSRKVSLICVDQDAEALNYSKNLISKLQPSMQIKYLQENVLKFGKNPEYYKNLFGKQDLIYSIGLADYLDDNGLKDLIAFTFSLAKDSGEVVIAHKDRERDAFAPLPIDWFCDWHFFERNESDLIKLCQEAAPKSEISVEREPTGIIFFVIIKKRKG